MKASLRAGYEPDKTISAATVSFNAGELKLRATMTEATIVNGPSLNGLALGVEKPGSFIVDYDVPKKDFRFQFMNTLSIAEKPLNLTYIHSKGDERTVINGTLVIDPANKVSANHVLGSEDTKLKYTYLQDELTSFEPSYDLGKNAWDFAVTRRVCGDDLFRATYQTSSKNLGLEWSRSSKFNGTFMVIGVSLDVRDFVIYAIKVGLLVMLLFALLMMFPSVSKHSTQFANFGALRAHLRIVSFIFKKFDSY